MNNLKLQKILIYAQAKIPYYKGLCCDINQLPIIDKCILAQNQNDFISRDIKPQDLYEEFTSGTTGEPLICYKSIKDKIALMKSLYTYRRKYVSDLKIDDKILRFYPGFNKNISLKENILYLSYLDSDDNSIKEYVNTIINYLPKIIFTTPSSLLNFIERINELQLRDFLINSTNFRYIELTGEILTPDAKKYIEDFFNCSVASHYGCREIWHIAYMCKFGNYHICDDNVHIEVVDEAGHELPEGCIGKIIITGLNTYAMPIIRYSIGDSGAIYKSKCACGNNQNILYLVDGRAHEYLIINGQVISSVIFHQIFKILYFRGYKGILKYSISTKVNHIYIKLMVSPEYSIRAEEEINELIKTRIKNVIISITYVKTIDLKSSGKSNLFV